MNGWLPVAKAEVSFRAIQRLKAMAFAEGQQQSESVVSHSSDTPVVGGGSPDESAADVRPPYAPAGSLIWFDDIESPARPKYLIKGLIGAGTLALVYGQSNTGKSFFALDLALHVAQETEWNGRKVNGGLVVYIAAEGAHSVVNRLYAAKSVANQHRNGSPIDSLASSGEPVPFTVWPAAVNLLCRDDNFQCLMSEVETAERRAGRRLALLVIDTLARSMTGGSENDGADMGQLIQTADYIREAFDATVMFIHHTGKDSSRGARGHSSLRAAADTEIAVAGTRTVRTATVTKQRDLPTGERTQFELEPIKIGVDEDGEDIVSCVVKHATDDGATHSRPRLNGRHELALRALKQAVSAAGKEPTPIPGAGKTSAVRDSGVTLSNWRDTAFSNGFAKELSGSSRRGAWKRVLEFLVDHEFVERHGDFVFIGESVADSVSPCLSVSEKRR